MQFENQINEDIKRAMLEKQEHKLRALRAIKSAIILFKTSSDYKGEINKSDEVKILQKLVKQRQDSIGIYEQQNRNDLLQKEKEELDIINSYLPAQLSENELKEIIHNLIKENNINKDPKEMGRLIGLVNKKVMGQADSKTISILVKDILA